MKDKFNNELTIGDEVIMILPKYRDLVVGTITSFTPMSMRLEYTHPYRGCVLKILQAPHQVVKVTK